MTHQDVTLIYIGLSTIAAIFLVALGHKLYQIYKYGGKVPTEPNDIENDSYEGEESEEPDYDPPVSGYNDTKSTYND